MHIAPQAAGGYDGLVIRILIWRPILRRPWPRVACARTQDIGPAGGRHPSAVGNDRMHIALLHHHVGGKAGGGGGVRLMLELGTGLVRRGHRVTIACHDHLAGSEFAYASDRLEIRAVREGVSEVPAGNAALLRRYWLELPKVARLVPREVDVVNAHEWLALRPGRIAARRIARPLVWTRNDETPWERAIVPGQTIFGSQRLGRRLVRAALTWPDLRDARAAAEIVVLSSQQVGMVRRSYGRSATVLGVGPAERFFEPLDRAGARARLGIAQDVFLVCGLGILVPHRRFEDLIDAMALLGDDPSIHALIAGSDHADPAYGDMLSARIEAERLADRVTLSRRSLSEAELKDTYAAADVFVILSQRYAWGLAPLEAIACGTPVILTPGAGVHEILDGRAGVATVAAHDPRATAEAIRRWRGGAGREGLEQTRGWLREAYSIERYVTRMEEIYTHVARGR
jgi:glycosyltransferase involved in cell wall biosynthesis